MPPVPEHWSGRAKAMCRSGYNEGRERGLHSLCKDMLAWQADAWACGQPIDGGDMVEAFGEWRAKLAAFLA